MSLNIGELEFEVVPAAARHFGKSGFTLLLTGSIDGYVCSTAADRRSLGNRRRFDRGQSAGGAERRPSGRGNDQRASNRLRRLLMRHGRQRKSPADPR